MQASTPISSNAPNYPGQLGRVMDSPGLGDRMTDVKYEHPPLIKSQINAWTQSVNAAAVVTALFAGTAAQLFGTVTSSSLNPGHTRSFLVLSSYAAVIFNALATMASIVLIDCLGDSELNEAGRAHTTTTVHEGRRRNVRTLDLLLEYGASRSFKYIFWQWMIYMFLGTFFMFMQIVVLMWMREGHGIAIPMMVITCVAITLLGFSAFRR